MQAAVGKKMARGQNLAAFSFMEPKVAVRDWGCTGTSQTSRSSSSMIDEIDLSFHETKEDQSLLTASWAMMQKEPGMIPASYDPSSYALSDSIGGLHWSVEGKLSALLDNK